MYIGVDLGTTACKCVLFAGDGTVMSEWNKEYPLILEGTHVEQDANLWWELVCEGIATVSALADGAIEALSISAQGISFVPVDKDGKTLANAISWLDCRATDETELLEKTFGKQKIYDITGKENDTSYTLPKLLWFKKHCPDVYDEADKFLLPLDFLNMRMCGRAVTDYSMASGTMMYNIADKCWDKELLDFAGIDESKLPEVGCMGDFLGYVTDAAARAMNINPGARVILGGQDQKLAAIGAGISDGICTVSFGTATAISRLGKSSGADCPAFRFNNDSYISEIAVMTSGAALKWLAGTMFCVDSYKEMDRLAREADSDGGLTFTTDFAAGASISGMTLSTTRGEIVHALYTGVSREVHDAIEALGGATEMRVFGGGAKSDVWCQILADTVGADASVLATGETASLGAAILASGGKISPAPVKKIYKANKNK